MSTHGNYPIERAMRIFAKRIDTHAGSYISAARGREPRENETWAVDQTESNNSWWDYNPKRREPIAPIGVTLDTELASELHLQPNEVLSGYIFSGRENRLNGINFGFLAIFG